jgi:hypothetical protein
VYPLVPLKPNLPALVVMPRESDFNQAMGRGLTTHGFRIYILTSVTDYGLAQNALDEYVADDGPLSIRRIVWENRSLGLENVDAHVAGMEQYGGQHDAAGVDHIGAILNAVVHTRGHG